MSRYVGQSYSEISQFSSMKSFGLAINATFCLFGAVGDIFHAAPNIDHSQDFVRRDIKEWLNWLRNDIGFDGWRLDFVRGFSGTYVKEYIETSNPAFAIGEYWDSLAYEHGNLCYNQDAHRQRIVNWINATGGTSSAFDVTTKGILHSALHNQYWRMIDPQGKPTGVVGWWPSRAVTFLENHDTGSTQGHWPFPRDKLAQGYAYILTHPGTPTIFYDHFYDFGIREMINELIEARQRAGIHCRSSVKIYHANNEGYVAQVGDTLVMKLGHFDWNPSKENHLDGSWQKFVDKGSDYQLWLRQ
uniref:alpha-amylase n=1 Tax=Cucumis sativus TaxID=3659 RepID=A0A0A0KVT9_CUCSA